MDRSAGPVPRHGRRYRVAGDPGVWCQQPHSHHKILRLSEDLPVVVEIIDTEEKIESFLQTVDHAITEGIVTVEKARVRLYRARGKSRT